MGDFHKWRPIEDLPEDARALTDGELESLLLVWNDHKGSLEQRGLLKPFIEKLSRSWAIETGIIEGAYTLDRGVTQTLIERGISAELIPRDATNRTPECVAAMLMAHEQTLEGLFEFVKGDRELSTSYIKQLHQSLLRHQATHEVVDKDGSLFEKKLEKGEYKKLPNNPTRPDGQLHEFAPPEQTASEMDRLIELHRNHVTRRIPVEVSAAWLHHRFTQIHPFQDGNGRVARALASVVFLKAGWFPLSIHRDQRGVYIDALECGDRGDLQPLTKLFVAIQRADLVEAIDISIETSPPSTADAAVSALRDRMVAAGTIGHPDWFKALNYSTHLLKVASQRLIRSGEQIRAEIGSLRPNFIDGSSVDFSRWNEYFALFNGAMPTKIDRNHPSAGVTLRFVNDGTFEFWLAYSAKGPKFHGLAAFRCGVCRSGSLGLFEEVFLVNYREPYDSALARFQPWLEQRLIEAITIWSNETSPPAA